MRSASDQSEKEWSRESFSEAQAKEDKVSTTLNWGNNAIATYSGKLAAVAQFLRTARRKPLLKAMVDVKQTDVILNDTLWADTSFAGSGGLGQRWM